MAKREKIVAAPNNYFTSEKANIQFVSSGCTLLDCALGGGWALGRVANIVGDKSTAKTALATEALINFINKFPDGKAGYREAEAAYDIDYAAAMGLPINKVDFGDLANPINTVEALARDLEIFVNNQIKTNAPGIYVIDSLDALSDEAEMERDIGEGSYGTGKAKQLSAMFRTLTSTVEKSKVLFLVISQVRDNIGAMFGEKHKRSGGHALDFYASQIAWLAHLKILKRTINKVERPYGVEIRAKIKKNKVGMPFRECDFEFHFGYGVEDLMASLSWLKEVGRFDAIDLKDSDYKPYVQELSKMNEADYKQEQKMVSQAVVKTWREIEDTFMPQRRKY